MCWLPTVKNKSVVEQIKATFVSSLPPHLSQTQAFCIALWEFIFFTLSQNNIFDLFNIPGRLFSLIATQTAELIWPTSYQKYSSSLF